MSLSLVAAWRWIHFWLAFALFAQSIELLRLRPAWGDRGIWRWETLALEYPSAVRLLLRPLLSEYGFLLVLGLRALAALALAAFASRQWSIPLPLIAGLFASTLLIVLRFRGPFNGGSDAMTLMMLIGAGIPGLAPGIAWVARAGLAWIAVNGTASYVLSGLAKVREPGWRSGRTLAAVLRSPHYGVPPAIASWLESASVCMALSWAVLVFEIGFPFAFAGPRACLFMVGTAFLFHALNARLLGLSRFLWIWPVAYPAIIYWVP